MDDFLFSLNAVMPIVLLVVLGYILKKIKLFTAEFLRVANKLTFTVLLPTLLFSNVYAIKSFSDIQWSFVLYAITAIAIIFALSVPLCIGLTKNNAQRGVLIQASYRSNYAIIGIPLASQLFGEKGAAAASVLSAFSIPLFNVLAVLSLSIFNKETENRPKIGKIISGIIKNPLIIGVVAGIACLGIRGIFEREGINFRLSDVSFLQTSLKYIGSTATPVALLVLGGQFEFSAVKSLKKQIIFGTVMRTVIVPALCLATAKIILPDLGGECFAAFVALFGTPVAVSSAIMAREMNADYDLAGQLVVWTTIVSSFTLFITIVIFRYLGVF